MENPDLPQEILVEIFSRIPTKSVGRCKTLSKYWNTRLSTPNFVNKHFISRKKSIQQENLAFVTKEDKSLCIITSPTKIDQLIDDNSLPDKCYSILGSCNGLILLNGSEDLILMNPITRKKVIVPPLSHKGYSHRVCGLGYDSCIDDYKIVEINWLGRLLIDVYSVKNGEWETLDSGCYPCNRFVPKKYECDGGAFLNGALHYPVSTMIGYHIVAFDLATEVFSEIPLPEEFVSHSPGSYGVSVVGGCLSIVNNDCVGKWVAEVWIMKEYGVYESWVKLYIQAEEGDRHLIAAMLCYVEDGELLFLTYRGYLFASDLKSGTLRKVVLGERDYWFSDGMAFVDSLVSPE